MVKEDSFEGYLNFLDRCLVGRVGSLDCPIPSRPEIQRWVDRSNRRPCPPFASPPFVIQLHTYTLHGSKVLQLTPNTLQLAIICGYDKIFLLQKCNALF